jgi:hypothetical protein
MHASPASTITFFTNQPFRRRIFTIPILTAVCWICAQKGCIWNPDISPAYALGNTPAAVTEPVPATSTRDGGLPPHVYSVRKDGGPPGADQGAPNRSLREASNLLRQAAAMLDKHDRTAIRLILRAITILKHEIMRGADGPEYDRISSAPSSSERQESWFDTWGLLSLLRHELVRYESAFCWTGSRSPECRFLGIPTDQQADKAQRRGPGTS